MFLDYGNKKQFIRYVHNILFHFHNLIDRYMVYIIPIPMAM